MSAADDDVFGFGRNSAHRLGLWQNQRDVSTPTLITSLKKLNIVLISCGENFSVALSENGTVYTWGENTQGQLGIGTKDYNPRGINLVTDLLSHTITQIDTGYHHTVALTSNHKMFCWGSNSDYQVAPDKEPKKSPVEMAFCKDMQIVKVGAKWSMTIALSKEGKVFQWGQNYNHLSKRDPTQLFCGKVVTDIWVGGSYCIAATKDHKIFGYGKNTSYQLTSSAPAEMTDTSGYELTSLYGKGIVQFAPGWYHCLALSRNNEVYAFGQNDLGQCGPRPSKKSRSVAEPVKIEALSGKKVIQIAAGVFHSGALTADGSVYLWGDNSHGQLGGNKAEEGDVVFVESLQGKGVQKLWLTANQTFTFIGRRKKGWAFSIYSLLKSHGYQADIKLVFS